MSTSYLAVPAGEENYIPVAIEYQRSLVFETGAETVRDLREHLDNAYAVLDRDDI